MDPTWVAVDDGYAWLQMLDASHHLEISGRVVRQERTGVHSRIAVAMNGTTLAWGLINVERDEERVRLTNSAWGPISGNSVAAIYPKQFLKNDVDRFCAGLWDAVVADLAPEAMAGEPTPRPPVFLLKPYVIEGGGTILFAPPGRGKSFTGHLLSVSIDSGSSVLWQVNELTPVLHINLERSRGSVRNRLGAVNRILGLDSTRPLLTMNARGRSLLDVLPAALRAVKGQHIRCVFLDSISRAGMGDLTENQPVNRIIDALNGLCPTWIALAHTPRKDESHVFGSMHFDAGADVEIQLLSQQDELGPLGVGLQITKENDIGKRPMQIFAYEFAEGGLTAVRPARPGEFPDIERGRKQSLAQVVKEYLLHHPEGKATATEIAEETGYNRANVSSALRMDNTFIALQKVGKQQFYGVKGATRPGPF